MARITQKEIHGVMTDVIEMDAPADELEDALRAQIAAEQAIESAETAQDAAERAEEAALRAEENIAGVSSFNGRYGTVKPQTGDYTAEDVGALPIIDARSALYNMDNILKGGQHRAFYIANSNTGGIPANGDFLILSYSIDVNYGSQFAFVTGGADSSLMYWRTMRDGTISNWSTGFLPLAGGTLTNSFGLDGRTSALKIFVKRLINGIGYEFRNCIVNVGTIPSAAIDYYGDDEWIARLGVNGNNIVYRQGSKNTNNYKIFGEHNKPSASYTGNGSATSRTIDTGGIGSIISLWSANGVCIVTPSGAFCKTGATVSALGDGECKFENGVLTIASKSSFVNANGANYIYQVL